MTDTPRQVLQFPPQLRVVPPKADCHGDVHVTRISPAKLMDALNRTKAGLDAGMTAKEIRDFEILRCEQIIKNQAQRHVELAGNRASAAIFLRALAADIEAEIE